MIVEATLYHEFLMGSYNAESKNALTTLYWRNELIGQAERDDVFLAGR